MKLRNILTTLCLMAISTAAAATGAEKIMDTAAAKIAGAKSAVIIFDISGSGQKSTGELRMCGNKFYFNSPETTVWFDGKTQWALSKGSGEVSVSEPDQDELMMVNPMVAIRNYRQLFSISAVTNSSASKIVSLVAKSTSNQIRNARVEISNKNSLPASILITLSNKQQIKATIKSLKIENAALPVSTFVFDRKKYSKAEVIDLR